MKAYKVKPKWMDMMMTPTHEKQMKCWSINKKFNEYAEYNVYEVFNITNTETIENYKNEDKSEKNRCMK